MAELSRAEYLDAETHIALRPMRDRGRCVLVFPNAYHVGMSSLSLHTVYALLNSRGLACERAFMPAAGDYSSIRSLESDTPLGGFEFVLITSSFELDWLNIPRMLQAGGVPPLARERDETNPLVIAGGPAVTSNPEPLADILDACLIGELEPVLDKFIEACVESDSREEVLERLRVSARTEHGTDGFYIPALPEHDPGLGANRAQVARAYADNVDEFSTETAILTPNTTFSDRFLIEVGRGCGRTCKFCLARQIYRPVRPRRPEMLLERVDSALPHTRRVGLVATAVSDYPWTQDLMAGLVEREAEVSVSSVRAESVSESLLQALGAAGQDMLTLAPEAGTEALRRQIGKNMTDDDLLGCIKMGVDAGITRYKLYFIIGLPGETQEDALSIPELIARLREQAPDAFLSVSVSPFVPKPHTPFQEAGTLTEAQVRRRLSDVIDELRRCGTHDVTGGSVRWGAAQAVLSRGGRELGQAIVEASLVGGGYGELKSAVKRHGRKWKQYLGPQEFEPGEAPWDVVACHRGEGGMANNGPGHR